MVRTVTFIPLILGVSFFVGIGLRIVGEKPIFSGDMVYRAAGEVAFPGTETPEDTAVSFYMYIDRGMYKKAYDISIEPDFYSADKPAPYKEMVAAGEEQFQGLIGKEEFVDRLHFELGPRGHWIKLHNIRGKLLEEPCSVSTRLKEKAVAAGMLSGKTGHRCYPVRVTGHLLGACTIFSWEKVVPVISDDAGYKVVLPGTKQIKQYYYQDWIMHVIKIFDLRKTNRVGGGM